MQYHLVADKLSKQFEALMESLERRETSKADMDREPSREERLQLSNDLFKINNTDSLSVLETIEAACPEALVKTEEEVLINFEELSSTCFHEVNIIVMTSILNAGSNGKKFLKKKTVDLSSEQWVVWEKSLLFVDFDWFPANIQAAINALSNPDSGIDVKSSQLTYGAGRTG